MATNEEEARKKRSQVRRAAFGTLDRTTGKSTTTYTNQLKQAGRGAESLQSGDSSAVFSGVKVHPGKDRTFRESGSTDLTSDKFLGSQRPSTATGLRQAQQDTLRRLSPTQGSARALGRERSFATGAEGTAYTGENIGAPELPTDIGAMARRRDLLAEQDGTATLTAPRGYETRGIDGSYKSTPVGVDQQEFTDEYGKALYSTAPGDFDFGTPRDQRLGSFTLGGDKAQSIATRNAPPAATAPGTQGRTDGRKYGFGEGMSFEERTATGDVFSHGAVGEQYRGVGELRSQARLGLLRGTAHPGQAAELYKTANEREAELRGMGIDKQRADAESGTVLASQIAALSKGRGEAARRGLDEAELAFKYKKLGSENQRFNVNKALEQELGVDKTFPLYQEAMKNNPDLTYPEFMASADLSQLITARRDLPFRARQTESTEALLTAEREKE